MAAFDARAERTTVTLIRRRANVRRAVLDKTEMLPRSSASTERRWAALFLALAPTRRPYKRQAYELARAPRQREYRLAKVEGAA